MKRVRVACAVILNENDKILICKRGKNKELHDKYEFPGGKLEENETSFEAIKREIKEELVVDINPFKYVGEIKYDYTNLDNPFTLIMDIYLSRIISGNIILNEHLDARYVSLSELNNYDFAPADKLVIELLNKEEIFLS